MTVTSINQLSPPSLISLKIQEELINPGSYSSDYKVIITYERNDIFSHFKAFRDFLSTSHKIQHPLIIICHFHIAAVIIYSKNYDIVLLGR